MVWHDCKTDPPKENGDYFLVYQRDGKNKFFKLITTLNKVFYSRANDEWEIYLGNKYNSLDLIYNVFIPIKWAEVDLSEVESMNNISKAPKASTPNPNLNYKPPIGNHIPVVEIIHSKDGVYDVYIDSQWQISRNHIDNVLQHLADYVGTFTLKFKDLTI